MVIKTPLTFPGKIGVCNILYACFKVVTKVKKKEMSKYAVKPPKDLASKFEAKVTLKAKEEEEALEQKRRDEEAMKIAVRR